MNLFNFIPGYETAIFDKGREPMFIMLLAFIVTFLFARGYTRLARIKGWKSVSFSGVHTHHMVFGVVCVLTSGALMLSFLPEPGVFLNVLAITFGVGVALVMDEFALLFHLEDVYWENEGRKSIDAVIISLAIGVIFLLQVTPFGTISGESGFFIAFAIAVNLPVVVVTALKGKIFMALFGVFIPLLALIGAIRLAEPDSVWARRYYREHSKKLAKSKRRYKFYEKYLRGKKEKLWDIIGGEIGRPN